MSPFALGVRRFSALSLSMSAAPSFSGSTCPEETCEVDYVLHGGLISQGPLAFDFDHCLPVVAGTYEVGLCLGV